MSSFSSETNLAYLDDYRARRIQHSSGEHFESTGQEYDDTDKGIEGTGAEIGSLLRRLDALERKVAEHDSDKPKASPENLYRPFGSFTEEPPNVPTVVRVRQILMESDTCLIQAISEYSDEIAKESHMDVFCNNIRILSKFCAGNRHFEDATTALLVAVEGHITIPYSKREIVQLRSLIALFKENVYMSESVLDKILDILDESGFDLACPFRGVDFNELS